MIYEYAVDPTLMTQKGIASNLSNSFGAEKGRLISDFPEEWDVMVYRLIRKTNKGTIEKHANVNRLIKFKKNGVIFKRTAKILWSNKKDWLEQAENEHSLKPFQAIVANVEEAELDKKIIPGATADDFYDCWKTTLKSTVSRNAKDMGQVIKPLLELSRQIVFVDRYFNPNNIWFRKVLEEFLEIISSRQSGIPVLRIIYHFSLQTNENAYKEKKEAEEERAKKEKDFKKAANEKLPQIIPKGINLIFQESPDGTYHDRFVLTDIGSVDMGVGLQEYEPGSESDPEIKIKNIGLAKEDFNRFSSKDIFHQVQGLK